MLQRALFRLYGAFFRYQAWSRRRFTVAGYAVLSAAVFYAALGVDTRYTLAYQAFAFLCALLVLAWLLALRRPPMLLVRLRAPRCAEARVPFRLHLSVANPGSRREQGLHLRLETPDPRPDFESFRHARDPRRVNAYDRVLGFYRYAHLLHRRRNVDHALAGLPGVPPAGKVELELEVAAYRRGLLRVSGFAILRADPLGLVRATRFAPAQALVLVLPRRYAVPRLALAGQRRFQPGGVSLATSVGDSEEFVSLRDYRPGDALRRIHWKSFARLGTPVVKEYQDEFFERYALVLDTFAVKERRQDAYATSERAFEEAVSVAASFACTLDTQEALIDLLLVESHPSLYRAGRGQMNPDALLEVLARVEPARREDFAVLRDAVLRHQGELSGVIVILLDWDEARGQLLEALRARGIPVLALLVCERKRATTPAWVVHLEPGKVQQGLAALC